MHAVVFYVVTAHHSSQAQNSLKNQMRMRPRSRNLARAGSLLRGPCRVQGRMTKCAVLLPCDTAAVTVTYFVEVTGSVWIVKTT